MIISIIVLAVLVLVAASTLHDARMAAETQRILEDKENP